jgi:hypothetical protein
MKTYHGYRVRDARGHAARFAVTVREGLGVMSPVP